MTFLCEKGFRFWKQQSNNDMQVDNMGDHATVCPEKSGEESSTTQHHVAIPIQELSGSLEAEKVKKPSVTDANDNIPEEHGEKTDEKGECRYCQEEEFVSKLEAPCKCDGTLKYAHRSCVVCWCNTKRNIICEICKQPYYPNYSVTGPPPNDEDDDIVMSERWTVPGTNFRILTPLQQTERGMSRLLRSMNSDFTFRNPSGGVIFGTLLLVILSVLVVRDAYYYTPPKEDKFSHILYIVVVIIAVPVYILSWISECRAQRERHSERERGRDLTG